MYNIVPKILYNVFRNKICSFLYPIVVLFSYTKYEICIEDVIEYMVKL